jgi:5-methylcytosine-specific restriction endonuclease McrA
VVLFAPFRQYGELPTPVSGKFVRHEIHPAIKLEVYMRDERRCTHVCSAGVRCSEKRGLEIHHIIEISKGGDDAVDNLVLLCSRHHQKQHPSFRISSQKQNRARDRFGRYIRDQVRGYA